MYTASYQPVTRDQAAVVADNLLRIMLEKKLNLTKLSELTGVDERTIRTIRTGKRKPSLSTYRKLAEGLEIDASELLDDKLSAEELFDRGTNQAAAEFVDSHRRLFKGWTREEYAEFFSRFGHGGALTDEGARATALFMNERREVLQKVAAILETPSREMLRLMVEQMWKRERVVE